MNWAELRLNTDDYQRMLLIDAKRPEDETLNDLDGYKNEDRRKV